MYKNKKIKMYLILRAQWPAGWTDMNVLYPRTMLMRIVLFDECESLIRRRIGRIRLFIIVVVLYNKLHIFLILLLQNAINPF